MLQYTNFKYCPLCGSIELIVQEHNGMKCNECGFIYFHNAASAVAAIIETPSGVLLVKRNHDPQKGFLDFPGGFVNYRESLEEALRREIKEELQLDLQNTYYFGSYPNVYKYENVTYFTTDIFFRCPLSFTPDITPNNEISEYSFVQKSDVKFISFAFNSAKEAMKYYLQ